MSQRGRKAFSPGDKTYIWKTYSHRVNKLTHHAHKYLARCGKDELPCPICYYPMNKYKRVTSFNTNPNYWNVDHIDGNRRNNKIENLQPAHMSCNCKKQQIPQTQMVINSRDPEKGNYTMTPNEYKQLIKKIDDQSKELNILKKNVKDIKDSLVKKHWWNKWKNKKTLKKIDEN